LQRLIPWQVGDGIDERQTGPHRPLRIILVSLRIAEIDQHPVAKIFGHEPTETLHALGNALLIGRNDLAQVLRIQTRRQRCRTDEVGKHYCDLATLSGVDYAGGSCGRAGRLRRNFVVTRDRPQELTPVTERNPDIFEVLIRKIGQDRKANVVLNKALRVLSQPELLKPISDFVHRPLLVTSSSLLEHNSTPPDRACQADTSEWL
jgi:hypothetical protein